MRSINLQRNESTSSVHFADQALNSYLMEPAQNKSHTEPVSILKKQPHGKSVRNPGLDLKMNRINQAMDELLKEEEDTRRFFSQFRIACGRRVHKGLN